MQLMRSLSPRQRSALRRELVRVERHWNAPWRTYYRHGSLLMARATAPDCAPSTRMLLIREARDAFICAFCARWWSSFGQSTF